MGLPKHRRLRRRSEFQRVARDGLRARDALLSISTVESVDRQTSTRYGFAIPKRVGGAVVRNRIKRRLRAIAAAREDLPGWDFVIYVYPSAAHASSEQLSASLSALTRRAMSRLRSRHSRTLTKSRGG